MRSHQVTYCKLVDTWNENMVLGWGYFIVDLFPRGTRMRLVPVEKPATAHKHNIQVTESDLKEI